MNEVRDFANALANEGVSVRFVEGKSPEPTRKYSNIEMERMMGSLEPLLERTDKIGYAAARNTRILKDETREYMSRREELVFKYGEDELDDEGNPTGRTMLALDSENFQKYAEEIQEWAYIEHAPGIFKLKYEDVIGKLTGAEILSIDWMLED